MSEQKETMIARIWATIAKRDKVRQLMLDNNDNFNEAAGILMRDLGKFCNMNKPTIRVSKITGVIDPIAMAVAEGRRETYLRILEILHFTDDNAVKMIEQLNQRED